MIEAAMGGEKFTLPAGCYVNCEKCGFKNVMMAMPSTIDKTGVHFCAPTGTEDELAALNKSYEHLCKMRDEIIALGIIPEVSEWRIKGRIRKADLQKPYLSTSHHQKASPPNS